MLLKLTTAEWRIKASCCRSIGMVVSGSSKDRLLLREGQLGTKGHNEAEAVSLPPKDAVPQHLSKDSMSRDINLNQTQPNNSQASP